MKRLAKRKCDVWISNNKVLVGNSKKISARNPNFETEETKLLIQLWGDPQVQKTLITTHKKHPVILKLAEQMREHGYFRSADEINTRIKNLKCFYNRIKKDQEMGIITEPKWKHFEAMEAIVTRPVFGNRVQQPHLLNRAADTLGLGFDDSDMTDDDSTDGLRPEDLLSLKEDEGGDLDFQAAKLVPKNEPVDFDEMEADEDCSLDNVFPKLSQYLQLAAARSKHTSAPRVISPMLQIKNSPCSSPEPPQSPTAQLLSALSLTPNVLPVSTPSITSTATITAATQSSGSTSTAVSVTSVPAPTQKKISLVPANMLMKPKPSVPPTPPPNQPQTINFGGEQYVVSSMCNGKTVYTSKKDGQPLKVLLVNTIPNKTASPDVSSAAPAPTKLSGLTGDLLANTLKAATAHAPTKLSGITGDLLANTLKAATSHAPTKLSGVTGDLLANTLKAATSLANRSALAATTVVSSASVAPTVSSSSGPVMPKPKVLPAPRVADTPVYATRSRDRANAIKLISSTPASATPKSVSPKSSSSGTETPTARRPSTSSSPPVFRQSQLPGSMSTKRALLQIKNQVKSSPAGFRMLLSQMITLQTEELNVSRQRLQVEKSRLQFEQTMGDKLLAVLTTLAEKK